MVHKKTKRYFLFPFSPSIASFASTLPRCWLQTDCKMISRLCALNILYSYQQVSETVS